MAASRVRKVALSRIDVDVTVQPRFRMSKDAINRYVRTYRSAPQELPPITLGKLEGKEQLIVVDGFHRLEVGRLAGLTSLPATIIETNMPEALWLAVEANIKHGVPISRAEKRTVFRRFVRADKHVKPDGSLMSSRELQRALPSIGTHQSMLSWMRDDFPKVHAQMIGGEEEEELEYEKLLMRPAEDEVMHNLEWAAKEYLTSIQKAKVEARPEVLLDAVARDVRTNLEAALGRTVGGIEDVVETLREINQQELEDDDY